MFCRRFHSEKPTIWTIHMLKCTKCNFVSFVTIFTATGPLFMYSQVYFSYIMMVLINLHKICFQAIYSKSWTPFPALSCDLRHATIDWADYIGSTLDPHQFHYSTLQPHGSNFEYPEGIHYICFTTCS